VPARWEYDKEMVGRYLHRSGLPWLIPEKGD
jgi:hypothetical protein